jgi:hypothetical protein
MLVEQLFYLRDGFQAVAVPRGWVEDDFVGIGHAAIISGR